MPERLSKTHSMANPRAIAGTRHVAIAASGKKLIANPTSLTGLAKLVTELVSVVSERTGARRAGQNVSIAKRVGALLNTYCPDLPPETAIHVRAAANQQLAPIFEQVRNAAQSLYVSERTAALSLGVNVSDLREMCCDRETRRQLGWPRPVAGRLLFRSAALDPDRAGKFFAELPSTEPWPASSWPTGWRS